ncbi:hypothetical protein, partial [Enterococcus faecium]|uniref:hypothetical protein n=1 Tax=Enterococcus faecium TaxID=1352 RepID=UPI001C30F8E6
EDGRLLPNSVKYKKTPSQPRTKTRGTTLIAMMCNHYLLNSITLSCVGISTKIEKGSNLISDYSFFSQERIFCES